MENDQLTMNLGGQTPLVVVEHLLRIKDQFKGTEKNKKNLILSK